VGDPPQTAEEATARSTAIVTQHTAELSADLLSGIAAIDCREFMLMYRVAIVLDGVEAFKMTRAPSTTCWISQPGEVYVIALCTY
jgi:hypothetical protein